MKKKTKKDTDFLIFFYIQQLFIKNSWINIGNFLF